MLGKRAGRIQQHPAASSHGYLTRSGLHSRPLRGLQAGQTPVSGREVCSLKHPPINHRAGRSIQGLSMAAEDRKVGDGGGNSWANKEEEGEVHKSSSGSCNLSGKDRCCLRGVGALLQEAQPRPIPRTQSPRGSYEWGQPGVSCTNSTDP